MYTIVLSLSPSQIYTHTAYTPNRVLFVFFVVSCYSAVSALFRQIIIFIQWMESYYGYSYASSV